MRTEHRASQLREIRRELQLSLNEMSILCDVSTAELSRVERGLGGQIRLTTAKKIAQGYDVSLEDLADTDQSFDI